MKTIKNTNVFDIHGKLIEDKSAVEYHGSIKFNNFENVNCKEIKHLVNFTTISVFDDRSDIIKGYSNSTHKYRFFLGKIRELKPIVFSKFINSTGGIQRALKKTHEYKNIQLIRKSPNHILYDHIIAWNDKKENCRVYLGKWNDGVV